MSAVGALVVTSAFDEILVGDPERVALRVRGDELPERRGAGHGLLGLHHLAQFLTVVGRRLLRRSRADRRKATSTSANMLPRFIAASRHMSTGTDTFATALGLSKKLAPADPSFRRVELEHVVSAVSGRDEPFVADDGCRRESEANDERVCRVVKNVRNTSRVDPRTR